jgi:hypothetical protein
MYVYLDFFLRPLALLVGRLPVPCFAFIRHGLLLGPRHLASLCRSVRAERGVDNLSHFVVRLGASVEGTQTASVQT